MNRFLSIVVGGAILMSPVMIADNAAANFSVKKRCINGVCGRASFVDGTVYITLTHTMSRFTHYNFKTNPGAQIEIGGKYSFNAQPGDGGTYSAQACDRGGIGARSSCTRWATFDWSSGEAEEMEEQ